MFKTILVIALFFIGLFGIVVPTHAANITATLDDAAARPASCILQECGGGNAVFYDNERV